MPTFWMVRAGEAGRFASDFERLGIVAIGWEAVGDISAMSTVDAVRSAVRTAYPEMKPGAVVITGSTLFKFRRVLRAGDRVVTYDSAAREYVLGTLKGDYRYDPKLIVELPHVYPVTWHGRVSRDSLSASTKNTLGSIVTLFEPSDDALVELDAALAGRSTGAAAPEPANEAEVAGLDLVRLDAVARAREFLKDRILHLTPDEMEELVAALLRAMGYKARVTPKGPDRGRDVLASPDGLGFQTPRIIGEVKHRKETIGAERVRSFLGGLRDGDCGLYVSTGGFTREARYEADRSKHPTTLVGLDDLADLVVEHYERFDELGRALVPMTRVYWPTQ